MNCPVCGIKNPEGARFCNACGTRLQGNAAEGTSLDPFLPKELLAKLEAARAGRAMEGERRIVTMLFCDVKGSTAMAETMDPEDWAEIMNGAFERLIAPVYRYEGTLARLMGDAIFAFFGAPIAHEDDPQRAVWAGLDILSGIDTYKEGVRKERGLDLNVRVGIHTGQVMVGQVGSDLRLEYTAMGDAVNVAARMEQTAEPGTVQITAATYQLVEPLFEFEARGGIEVKGKAEPVEAYTVTGRRRAAAPARGMRDSPLVGRERELAELTRAIEEAQEGGGRIVSLIGEAGLGKSRLIAETRAGWASRVPGDLQPDADAELHRSWEAWQCVSYDATRPYSQYRRTVARIAGVEDTDPPDVVRTKLAAAIEQGAPDWLDPHMQVWRSLFGVTEPGEEPLEGEAFRASITDLVTSSTRAFGSDAPRLMVFEDLHWCDEASMDVLIETTKLVDELPCLFVFAYRPDRDAPSWRLKQWLETEYPHRSTELTLTALSGAESGRLIDALIPDADAAVRAQILERSDGNPLFLEEVTAAVHEHRVDVSIPTTLQALFTARLDALDEDAKHALQLASVIGRSFTEPVLRAVSGDDDLSGALRTLERTGLIIETARTPERTFAFRHSLTQEATYGTILLRRRRELHRRVAEVFEELYANRIDAPLLAQHAREGEDDERTLRYATLAADADARLYAHAEAVTHTTWAIEAAGRLGRTAEALAHLYPNRGRALELSARFDEAAANYREMESLAQAGGNRTAALAADMALTTLYATPTPLFDAAAGRTLCERTIALARELGDRSAESKALWNLMILDVFGGGDEAEAIDAGERSLSIARELGAREQIAFTLNDLWRPYAAIADFDAARAVLDESRPLWRELDNLPMLSENLSSTSALVGLSGAYDEALALSAESYAIAGEIGNPWGQSYCLLSSYHIDVSRGDFGRAITKIRECIELAERAGFLIPQAVSRADLGAVYASLGAIDEGAAMADEGLAIARDKTPIAVPIVMGSMAEILLVAGRLDDAERAIAESVSGRLPGLLGFTLAAHAELLSARAASIRGDHVAAADLAGRLVARLRPLEVRQFTTDAILLRGAALVALDKLEDAKRVLIDGRVEAEHLGVDPTLWRIEIALSDIAAATGDPAGAAGLAREAKSLIDRLADRIGDKHLRTSFLDLPEVRAVDG
jgi:class 3 adenylate cyclase/tetratricopeptide (TPR) repeat protein